MDPTAKRLGSDDITEINGRPGTQTLGTPRTTPVRGGDRYSVLSTRELYLVRSRVKSVGVMSHQQGSEG